MKKSLPVLFLICFAMPSVVLAHPGHGRKEWEFSLIHYLLDPVHFIPGFVFVGCIFFVILRLKKANTKNKYR